MQTAKEALPDSLGNEVRRNVRNALQEVIAELDVVSREELDAQKSVLQKTRAKVDRMEQVIAELEARVEKKPRK